MWQENPGKGMHMKCKRCERLRPTPAFGSYAAYLNIQNDMEQGVQDGDFAKTAPDALTAVYHCLHCGTDWSLARPDFPVRGYFIEEHRRKI